MEIEKYHLYQRIVHWVMALIIIVLLVMGYIMQDLPNEIKFKVYGLHKSFGVLVIFLFFARIYLRLKYKAPALPKDLPKYVHIISSLNHKLLYILMFLMPISGYLMSNAKGYGVGLFNVIKMPFLVEKNEFLGNFFYQMHEIIAVIFIITIILHILGVVKHSLEDKKFIRRII